LFLDVHDMTTLFLVKVFKNDIFDYLTSSSISKLKGYNVSF